MALSRQGKRKNSLTSLRLGLEHTIWNICLVETILGIANGGFHKGGFQIVERAAFSWRRNLLLQGNSYQNLTLHLLLRPRFGGLLNYCKNPLPGTPPFEFPDYHFSILWHFWVPQTQTRKTSVDVNFWTNLGCGREFLNAVPCPSFPCFFVFPCFLTLQGFSLFFVFSLVLQGF